MPPLNSFPSNYRMRNNQGRLIGMFSVTAGNCEYVKTTIARKQW
jgi:hypothetical protein